MALEQTAGPYTIAVDSVAVNTFSSAAWIQGLGLLSLECVPATGTIGTYVAQMDGAAMFRSPFSAGGQVVIVDLRSVNGLDIFDGTHFTSFDYVAGAPQLDPWLTLPSTHTAPQVVLTDRFLKVGTEVDASLITDGVTYIPEYTFTGTAPSGQVTVSRTKSPGLICLAWGGNGQIRFYDTVARTQVGPTQFVGEGFDQCWYIPKWDIFLELKNKQLKVYANAVRPASLSNPSALSAVQAGLVTQWQVQVLGAQGEPCVGELVNWSIGSGDGSLTALQSTTDDNGNAQVGYICPVGSSGSVTIDAEVDF